MENKYIRNGFNGFTQELYEWEQLNYASFLKEEYRKEEAEKELIAAYVHAAESLYSIMYMENNPNKHLKVITYNQLCIPMLFLCRHAIELSLKRVIEEKTGKIEKGHKLKNLWEKFRIVTQINDKTYNDLIDAFSTLDEDGLQLRYAKDLNGEEYKIKPIFVKADLIIEDTKKLYNYLTSIVDGAIIQ